MRTFFKRWWIVNALYHFSESLNSKWVDLNDFIDWVCGKDISDRPLHWYSDVPEYTLVYRLGFNFLGYKSTEKLYAEISDLIYECADQSVNYINIQDTSSLKTLSDEVRVSARGLEIYSVSYLIHTVFDYHWVKWGTTAALPVVAAYLISNFLSVNFEIK